MIILDASVLVYAVGEAGSVGERARAVLREAAAASAPDIADVETVSALRRMWQTGKLDVKGFRVAIDDLATLPLTRYPSRALLRRAYMLRDNLTPYDACYVALAEALGCPLYTADTALANAPGPKCEIRLFP
ncbi:type II toxin-antitoxin system VapC family toxin [Frankia sp. AgB1.9]|uniref:type II toxin-antitoxin system VapC family toxin n=1 Tax=unclassified Frankia TaxID=2632575 RepID=UPI0019344407|nr:MULTISPECIES: type II toxin-antitoxin system VapC family toxin [unclassified Frankia]MBL7494348.1 type II toxin-antitoxin system VapC family toxin [Frankia sp. AgW1.1]MBL7553686.1 type II toxin-antitoxin system VapC family toxin [Frankia sp. AgB1.9]MBL7617729.1 type II toxin-antitoxin system VapC family toxin [Frankia sp. AgB1.8]